MVEGLFLDRIYAESRRAAVGGEDNAIILPPTYKAQATLALLQLAVARTDVALDASVVEPMPMTPRSAFQTLSCSHRIHRVSLGATLPSAHAHLGDAPHELEPCNPTATTACGRGRILSSIGADAKAYAR